jgi:signal transduction histidine kinase
VRLPRLFSTTSFKLAALFALIFGVSTVAVGAFVYVNVRTTLDQQERTRVQTDALALKGEFDSGGMRDMMAAIHERQANKIAGGLNYTLFKSNGERILGTIPRLPLTPGWKHLSGPPDGDEPPGELERLLVYRLKLSPDLWLVVGDDIGRLHDLDNDFLRVFTFGLVLTLALAAAGGTIVSMTFLRRIDSIGRTAEAIIEGNIGQRIPLTGSNDDLDRLAATLNRMLDRIGMLMDTLRHVSTDIAHDLRTPLGHLRQVLDDARERAKTPEEYRAAIELAIAKTDATLETFAAILRIAQIESGSRRSGFKRVDLSAIMLNVAQSFAPTAEEQGQTLVTSIAPNEHIFGDRELITQLGANLIDNAIRHTPKGSQIAMRLNTQNGAAILEVSDNGAGVPASEREHIFNRFYRGEASRTTPGNGLGLNLVAAVAGLHRATVSVLDNKPGLKVRVEFPFGDANG